MSKHFLNGTQIGAFIQQMRGKRMAQGVRMNRASSQLRRFRKTATGSDDCPEDGPATIEICAW